MFALLDDSVAWGLRERCIRSLYVLYRDLFGPRCSDHLGHLDKRSQTPNPLNLICYMWWEICPLPYNHDHPERERIDSVILEVLRQTLQLDSNPCREGALHGLGHLSYDHKAEVCAIIDEFLQSANHVSQPLREYARRARTGSIL